MSDVSERYSMSSRGFVLIIEGFESKRAAQKHAKALRATGAAARSHSAGEHYPPDFWVSVALRPEDLTLDILREVYTTKDGVCRYSDGGLMGILRNEQSKAA